jgi:hypothetical protein
MNIFIDLSVENIMSTVATPASSICPSFVDDEEIEDNDLDSVTSTCSERQPLTEEEKQYFYLTIFYLISIAINLLCVFACILYYNRLKTRELELEDKYTIMQNDFKTLFDSTMEIMHRERRLSLEDFNRFGKYVFEVSLFDDRFRK